MLKTIKAVVQRCFVKKVLEHLCQRVFFIKKETLAQLFSWILRDF